MKYGDVIIFPTDTVYGIGTKMYDQTGIHRIYEIKKRSIDKKIPVLCHSIEQLKDSIIITDDIIKITKAFWPGALTLIVKTTNAHYQNTGEQTLAVRSPNHKELLNLLGEIGPLRTTSLNMSGEKPLEDILEIVAKYQDVVDHIYKFDDKQKSNVSSTIIDVSTSDFSILRQGHITLEQIMSVLD